ncbi:serine hydrolase domain-containing protein [Thiomonas delicata]|nr:serine hydrolase domain-containing protein [Thiomonas delicata]
MQRKIFLKALGLVPMALPLAELAGCVSAPKRPQSPARGDHEAARAYITALIRYEMVKHRVAGLSIALVDDQRIVWAQGFGYADLKRKIPASETTLYRVGSISKLFTAMAAMQLSESGKLDIGAPLLACLPGFEMKTRQPHVRPITPRQLMTHHAGLPRDRLKGFMHPHPQPFADLVKDLRHEHVAYPPDEIFAYSNLGISLLGAAIQNIAGAPFADHMRREMLNPLEMRDSAFETGYSNAASMAKGYLGCKAIVEYPLRDVPAGGLNSNVVDMSRFISMVFAGGASGGGCVLQAQTMAEMLRPQNEHVPLDLDFRIGLGWFLGSTHPALRHVGQVAGHGGATRLHRSQLYVLPEHKLGVVVLANTSTATPVVDRVAAEALALALEVKTGIRPQQLAKPPMAETPISADDMRTYAGSYTTLAGLVTITSTGKGLCAHVAGRRFDVKRRADGTFALAYSLLGIIPLHLKQLADVGFSRKTLQGRDILVAHIGAIQLLAGQRLGPTENDTGWERLLGEYDVANLDGDFSMFSDVRAVGEHGFLLVEMKSMMGSKQTYRVPLLPVSEHDAIAQANLAGMGETVRCVTFDGVQGLAFSGYYFKPKSSSTT